MDHSAPLVDLIILVAGIVLILLTSIRVSRRRFSRRKPVKGQGGALVGIAVWLGFLGVAIYLIFR